jgi:hypothetical protein
MTIPMDSIRSWSGDLCPSTASYLPQSEDLGMSNDWKQQKCGIMGLVVSNPKTSGWLVVEPYPSEK